MNEPELARRLIAASALLGALSCQRPDVARIELTARDFELYGREPFELPVRVIDRDGSIRPKRELKMRVVVGSVVRVLPENNAVVCRRAGAAQVELGSGALRETVTVTCRPITGLRWPRTIEMTVGDPPRAVAVQAVFESGEEEVMRPLSLTTRHEHVARMHGDSLIALAPGRTMLDADLGGRSLSIGVFVSAVIASDTLALRAGQFRNWVLDPGRYTMTVAAVQPPRERRWLDFFADGTRCVPSQRVDNTVTCVVYERGAVVVRNAGQEAAGPARRAFVRIVRTP
ncbi:MAG: hypothetical protein ACYC3F_08660 [Gemmatimonadaceae bacterium]